MDQDATLSLFDRTGARLNGHFLLTSGLHSSQYLQCARVLQFPNHAAELGRSLAESLLETATDGPIGGVVSPAMGGLIIGHEVARALGVRHLFTERDAEGKMTLRRGFEVTPGERFAVIEDVVTTGGSTREVVDLLRDLGAQPVAAGSIIDRSAGQADVGVPRQALATLLVESWDPASCPLCAAGSVPVKPGSRKN